jgi:type II secretory pathway pseudopilin PulG
MSLIEVVVSVAIFGLSTAYALTALSENWDSHRRLQERLYVSRVLDSRLEEIRDLTFDEVAALTSPMSFDPVPATTLFGHAVNPTIVDAEFTRPLRNPIGTLYVDDRGTDLLSVTIEVSWEIGLRGTRVSMVLTSLVTRNGVGRR